MAGDLVMANQSSLTETAPKFATHAGLVTDMSGTVQSLTSELTATMSGIPELGGFNTHLETVSQNLNVIMQCHADALMRTHQGLLNTAQSFQTTDVALAHILNNVAMQFQGFTGYETPIISTPNIPPITNPFKVPSQPATNPPNFFQNIWGWLTTP